MYFFSDTNNNCTDKLSNIQVCIKAYYAAINNLKLSKVVSVNIKKLTHDLNRLVIFYINELTRCSVHLENNV